MSQKLAIDDEEQSILEAVLWDAYVAADHKVSRMLQIGVGTVEHLKQEGRQRDVLFRLYHKVTR
jgi:hypothetical protein